MCISNVCQDSTRELHITPPGMSRLKYSCASTIQSGAFESTSGMSRPICDLGEPGPAGMAVAEPVTVAGWGVEVVVGGEELCGGVRGACVPGGPSDVVSVVAGESGGTMGDVVAGFGAVKALLPIEGGNTPS